MLSCACYYWHVVTTRGSSQLFAPPASCCASSVVEENVSYAQVNPEAPKAIPRSNLALSFIVELCPRLGNHEHQSADVGYNVGHSWRMSLF